MAQHVIAYNDVTSKDIKKIEDNIRTVQGSMIDSKSDIEELLNQVRLKEARTFESAIRLGLHLQEWTTAYSSEAKLKIKGNRTNPAIAKNMNVIFSQVKERFQIGQSFYKTFITWANVFGDAVNNGTLDDGKVVEYIESKQIKSIDRLPLHPDVKKEIKARTEKRNGAPPKPKKGTRVDPTLTPDNETKDINDAPPVVQVEYAVHEAEEQLNDAVKILRKNRKIRLDSPAMIRIVTSIRNHIKYLEKRI